MIGFDPWIVGLLVLAALVSLGAAARRGRRQLVGTTIAVLALSGLVLAPEPGVRTEGTVLLTEGATSTELALSASTFAFGDDPSWPRSVERIDDSGALLRNGDLSGLLTIAGHGLDPWDTERLSTAESVRIATSSVPPMPDGITRISWRRDLSVGQPLVVTGALTGGGTLRLEGPGGRVEQIASARQDETPFTLDVTPPGAGRFLFDLTLERPGGGERVGTIDVHVRESEPPTLLWLERAPSFETRHAKQWLTAVGGRVAVRTTVSRDRFRFEYHNLDRIDLSRLTPNRLERFDVVVVDAETWTALPGAERQAIERVIRSGSLGVVLRLDLRDGAPKEAPFGVAVRQVADLDRLMVRPAAFEEPPDPIAIPPFELDAAGTPIFQDRSGRVLAVERPLGDGSAVVTALTGSYRWVLSGRPDAHRAYWIALLEAAAPRDDRPRWLLPGGPIPERQPLTVTLAGDSPAEVRLIEPDGHQAAVPMRQHPMRPDRFTATLWPRLPGWHRLEAGDSVALFHAVPATDWQSWRLTRRRDATALLVSRPRSEVPPAVAGTAWLRLAALVLLIAALAYAWIDERRSAV